MILYHINIGFPILDENAVLLSTSNMFLPRDADAVSESESWNKFHLPREAYKEKVYFHNMATDSQGYVYSAILNKDLLGGVGVYVKYKKQQLPRFIQWKMMGEGTYVVGMEPANALVMGRDREKAWRTLQYLKPQESRDFDLELGVLVGDEIAEFRQMINTVTKGFNPEKVNDLNTFIDMSKK
jgi:hypothetical protein